MQSTTTHRKRPAPGASPLAQQQTATQDNMQYQTLPDNSDYSSYDFTNPYNTDAAGFNSPVMDGNSLAYSANAVQPFTYNSNLQATPSTELVRRTRNQQLANLNAQQAEQWDGTGGTNVRPGEEDEQDLEMKVEMAKRDAQGKRKQIFPFVQKLSSFLDSNNTDLIRWSDDGRSFIVLDEDEFARTLIPELFKHNNYTSFVRQLNMYGFHKTVNITDGSLRQSEKARKGVKPPSTYSHPYFRRNQPDLLWLIQKPTGKSTAKRKRDGTVKENFESDDERQFSPAPEGKLQELGTQGQTQDLATLPRNELAAVRSEIQKVQAQQRLISKMISQLKEQNDHFYRQATAFQALHDRHENSINAILTFLATFYNRSLDGAGAQNLVNMFSNHAQSNQQHGSVVEEYNDSVPENNQQLQRFVKRPPLLLPGPVSNLRNQAPSPGIAVTQPNSARGSVSPPDVKGDAGAIHEGGSAEDAASTSPIIKDDAPTPDVLHQVPESDQMMNLINSVNATNASTPNSTAPSFDFSSALDHYQNANGNSPLTTQQRNDMLALMANQSDSSNNALVNPQAPQMPDLNQLRSNQQQLEMLTNMQKQQENRVQELNRRVQPLSPTGSIPGLGSDDNPFDFTGAPGDYDPNAFINFDDSAWNDAAAGGNDINFDFGNSGENGDIDWDFDNTGTNGGTDVFNVSNDATNRLAPQRAADSGGGRIESVSSEATSPAVTIPDGGEMDPGTPNKKQRKS